MYFYDPTQYVNNGQQHVQQPQQQQQQNIIQQQQQQQQNDITQQQQQIQQRSMIGRNIDLLNPYIMQQPSWLTQSLAIMQNRNQPQQPYNNSNTTNNTNNTITTTTNNNTNTNNTQQLLPPPPPPPPPPRRQSQQQLPPRGKSQQQLPPPPPPPPKPKKKVEPIMLKKEHYFVAIDNVPSSNRMIEKFKLLVNTHLPLGIYRHAGNLYVEFDQNAARYARLIDGKVLKSKSTGVTWVISAMAIKRSEVNASWKPLIAKFSQKSKDKLVKIIRDQIKFPSSIAPSKEAYKALVKMLKKRIQMQITEDNLKNTKAMIKMIRNMLKKEREKIKHA